MAWPSFDALHIEAQVAKQVAAPAVTRTPNLHRATRSLIEECGWKDGGSGDSAEEKTLSNEKKKQST
jgi:hypothetical protein